MAGVDPRGAPATDPLVVMAAAYGVRREIFAVATAVQKNVLGTCPGLRDRVKRESFAQVVGILGLNDPQEFDSFRRGLPIASWLKEMMVGMVAVYDGADRAEEIVDAALGELASRLTSGTM